MWPPGQAPLPPKPWSSSGRRPCNVQRGDEHKPVSVKDLALSLGKKAWRNVTWREGSNAPLASRFAAVRVHPASRDYKRTTPYPVEWLLVEWPKGEAAPTKYWLSTLPEDTPLATLVDYAKLRWPIERDYEELKGELGLSHYEGRGWRGFHHHATLCIAAYGFLISERDAIPPSASRWQIYRRLLQCQKAPFEPRPADAGSGLLHFAAANPGCGRNPLRCSQPAFKQTEPALT